MSRLGSATEIFLSTPSIVVMPCTGSCVTSAERRKRVEEGRSLRSDLPSSTLLRLSALVTHDPVQGITTIDGVERKISVADPRRDIASLLEAMNGQRTLGQLRSRFTVGDSVLELILYLVNIRSIADVNKLWGPFHTMRLIHRGVLAFPS